MPDLSDMELMPYMRCVILEVLRWQPVSPLGEKTLRPLNLSLIISLLTQESPVCAKKTTNIVATLFLRARLCKSISAFCLRE